MAESDTAPEGKPFNEDRGWRGMVREPGEAEAFVGVAVLLLVVVLATLLFGLPGLFFAFLALTFVSLTILVVISIGN